MSFQPYMDRIAEFSKEHEEIVAVYLFGSVATGKSRRGSDLDIAIILNRVVGGWERVQLETSFSNLLGKDVDLVVFGQANNLLQHQILKYGHLVYECNKKERVRQEVAARWEYLDSRFLHKELESVRYG